MVGSCIVHLHIIGLSIIPFCIIAVCVIVPLAHLLRKSPIDPLILIVHECIFMLCKSVHMHVRVYIYNYRNCSRAINYFIIIKHA